MIKKELPGSGLSPSTTRRTVLKGSLAGLALGALGMPYIARAQSKKIVKMQFWGDTGVNPEYARVAKEFNAANPGVEVQMVMIPYGQYYQELDTSIQGGAPADLVRFEYQTVGRYGQAGVLIDLTSHFDSNLEADYLPAFWQPVHKDGVLFAIPQNTDTYGVFYNKSQFEAAGITAPTDIDKSWTWAEFLGVAQKLLDLKKSPYAFAMGWGQGAAYRALPMFFQHDAHLLTPDQSKSAMDSKASIETIAWLQSWFTKKYCPPNTSVKSQEDLNVLFSNGTIGMYLGGDWNMPDLEQNIGNRFEWGTTFLPRDINMAADLGGSCVGVTQLSQNKEEAIAFLKYLTDPQVQIKFLGNAQYLPVRKSILDKVVYTHRSADRQVFVKQATTVPPELSRNYALPYFAKINDVLNDQLDLCFAAGQSPEQTATNLAAGINQVIADNA